MQQKTVKTTNLSQLNNELENNIAVALFFSSSECSVCHADLPRVEILAKELGLPLIHISADEAPEIRGQLGIFSVPTVLLYLNEREYHRQSVFIDFRELKKRMEEITLRY